MKRSVSLDMSEAVIDNIIMLFNNTEDDNDFLSDPDSTFKHFFIDYLNKTGWNGWLIVTKYLPAVIRKSILNEVIDYCTSKSVDSKDLESCPLWFDKLHRDTIYLLIARFKVICQEGLSRGIGLSYEWNLLRNTMVILATEETLQDFSSTGIEYARMEIFPQVVSGHQSILDTLFSNYVAYSKKHDIEYKSSRLCFDFQTPRRMNICRSKSRIRSYGLNDTLLCNNGKSEEGKNQDAGNRNLNGGSQQLGNCLDIFERCMEENEKANQKAITSFDDDEEEEEEESYSHIRSLVEELFI